MTVKPDLPQPQGFDWNIEDTIPILRPKRFGTDALPVRRIPLGIPEDQKPCLVQLPNGELLLTAFHMTPVPQSKSRAHQVDILLYRSRDGGLTWSNRQVLDLLGVEPYFSVLTDGTLFVTANVLSFDSRNPRDYTYTCLHRSTDGGVTWETLHIDGEQVPGTEPRSLTLTSRNVPALSDGTLILGVSSENGLNFLWRSNDSGRHWDKTLPCEFEGVDTRKLSCPLMNEAVLWQARSGAILGLFRVNPRDFPDMGNPEDVPGYDPRLADQYECLLVFRSRDGGRHWQMDGKLGSDYGEMYPSILRLRDGRLLLTFTVRALHPPLGVQAVLGEETVDGFRFDFDHDRLVIDRKTPMDEISGGGFGPTVQLKDGTLLTAYSYRGGDKKIKVDSFLAGEQRVEVARWR